MDLGIGFQKDFEAFLGAVGGHEDFLLDLAFDPVEILVVLGFGVFYVVLGEVILELVKDGVVDFEIVSDGGFGAEVVASETSYALFSREEDIVAIHGLLELGGLGLGDNDVRSDATTAGNLATAISLANFGRMIGNLALVVIFVERDGFVIALNKATAGSVVASGGESEAGVFSERLNGLNETFAEGGFADDEAAVMVLNSAGNDFSGGSGIVVDQDDDGNGHALIAADGAEVALWSAAAMIGNDHLALFEEHVADSNGFVEKAAGIATKIEDQAVKRRGAKGFEGFSNFAIGSFVELGEANVADAGLEHESDIDGVTGNFIAGNGKHERVGVAFTSDGDFYDGALGTFEEVSHFAGGESIGDLFVDFDDDVTGAKACVIGRSADVGRHDDSAIFAGSDDHADAVVFAALIFTEKSELASVEEIGVGVEHAQHAGDGTLIDDLVDIDRESVIGLDDIENFGEVHDGGLVIVGIRGGGADGGSIDGAETGGEGQDYDDDYKSTAFSVHQIPRGLPGLAGDYWETW